MRLFCRSEDASVFLAAGACLISLQEEQGSFGAVRQGLAATTAPQSLDINR